MLRFLKCDRAPSIRATTHLASHFVTNLGPADIL
jgi:hypothetical protein